MYYFMEYLIMFSKEFAEGFLRGFTLYIHIFTEYNKLSKLEKIMGIIELIFIILFILSFYFKVF